MTIRDLLRGIPVFARPLPSFDAESAPEQPLELFRAWLTEAIDAGADEPYVMTVCTVGADGRPDARMLILKDLDEAGWHFATSSLSAKGRQLAGNPHVTLLFYWREQGRQVRVRGTARAADPETCRRDFPGPAGGLGDRHAGGAPERSAQRPRHPQPGAGRRPGTSGRQPGDGRGNSHRLHGGT